MGTRLPLPLLASFASLALCPVIALVPAARAAESSERELTPSERQILALFGPETPRPLLLWPGPPPQVIASPPPEVVTPPGRISVISQPSISVYLPPREKRTGLAIIMFPGGGYGGMDWVTHVVGSATCLVPEGVTIIGLKYRTRNPYPGTKEIQKIAILDAQRAVRLVRSRAAKWGITRLGVAGYSAGANLAMLLAGNFDAGDPPAADPVERFSSRPDFVVGCATWHWREPKSPFVFRRDTPPVFLVHATNDGLPGEDGRIGGAPIQLAREIKAQLEELGVPVHFAVFGDGGHGVGNLIPARYQSGFPGAQWPKLLQQWLATLPTKPPSANARGSEVTTPRYPPPARLP